MFRFTGAGQTSPARRFQGDFNVSVEDDPAGSTLVLEFYSVYSSSWKPLPRAGADITYTQRDTDLVQMRQSQEYRLRCSVYGGTPFTAGLLGS